MTLENEKAKLSAVVGSVFEAHENLTTKNKEALAPYFKSGTSIFAYILRLNSSLIKHAKKDLVGKKVTWHRLLDSRNRFIIDEITAAISQDEKALRAMIIFLKQFGSRILESNQGFQKEIVSIIALFNEVSLEQADIEPTEKNMQELLGQFFYRSMIGTKLDELTALNLDSKFLEPFKSVKIGDTEGRLPKNGLSYDDLIKVKEFQQIESKLLEQGYLGIENYQWPKDKAKLKALCSTLFEKGFFKRKVLDKKIGRSHIERYLEARYETNIAGVKSKAIHFEYLNDFF